VILFCHMVYVYVCKICEKFYGCWWSFSWLGQKVNKKVIKTTSLHHSVDKMAIFDSYVF